MPLVDLVSSFSDYRYSYYHLSLTVFSHAWNLCDRLNIIRYVTMRYQYAVYCVLRVSKK